jgi:hypothetical protein
LGLEEAAEPLVETLNEENEALEKLESKLQDLIVASAADASEDEESEEEDAIAASKSRPANTSRSGSKRREVSVRN